MKKIILIGIMLLGANEETYGQLSRKPVNAQYIGQDFCVVDSTISTWYEYGNKPSGTWTYKAIYLDRKKLKYYSVTNIVKTNDIYYTYDAKKQEEVFRPDIRKYEKKLLYVGNISELERVYIDTNDNKQYVKRLIPLKLDVYDALDPKDILGLSMNKQKLKDNKLYPAMLPALGYSSEGRIPTKYVRYTNKTGQRFDLFYSGYLSEEFTSNEEWWARNDALIKYCEERRESLGN